MVKQVASKLWWEAKNRRWSIKYRGKSYGISCRQLREREPSIADTKLGSESAARRWWEEKRHAIDGERLAQQGIGSAIANAAAQQQRTARIGNESDSQFWRLIGQRLQNLTSGPTPLNLAFDPETGRFDGEAVVTKSPVVLSALARFFALLEEDKQNAIAFIEKHAIPQAPINSHTPATIGECVARYTATRRADFDRKTLSADQLGLIVRCLRHFSNFVGPDSPVSTIDEKTIEGYRSYTQTCRSRPNKKKKQKIGDLWSSSFVRQHFAIAKQFVNWLYELRYLEIMPRNLKSLTIKITVNEVETFTIDEVSSLLGNSSGLLKLALLLSLNTGMTQKDISDLRPDEVDWKAGRITRKRSKTRDHKNVPTISYPLWPETFELLQEHRSQSADRVLLNEDGNPLVEDKLHADGRHIKNDTIHCAWFRLKQRVALRAGLSFKHARKTGASLLANEFDDAIAERYLGHSARSVAGKHYIKRDQERFDAAIAWLGEKLGIANAIVET